MKRQMGRRNGKGGGGKKRRRERKELNVLRLEATSYAPSGPFKDASGGSGKQEQADGQESQAVYTSCPLD